MPGSHCSIPECSTTSVKCRGLSYHKLPNKPSEKEWRLQLINKICRSDNFNLDTAQICSRHFEDDCFTFGKKGRRGLAYGSLPTKFMPQKSIVTPTAPPRKEPVPRPAPVQVPIVCYYNIEDVCKDAKKIKSPWVILQTNQDSITLGYYANKEINIQVDIDVDLIAHVSVMNFKVETLSTKIEKIRLSVYLKDLADKNTCPGITEKRYQIYAPLSEEKCGYFKHITYTQDDKIQAQNTVRSTQCSYLISPTEELCKPCKKVKSVVKKKHKRRTENKKCPISKWVPLRGQAKKKLRETIKQLRKSEKQLTRKLNAFKAKINKDGVEINDKMHTDLISAIENGPPIEDSLTQLFWKEQQKAFSRKKGGMRWHPAMVRLAILLHSRSPAAYNTLRDTGVLRLPGETTLRDYTSIIQPKCGRNTDVIEDIKATTKDLKENERFVVLLHDEMAIKADLVYDRTLQEVIGFVNQDTWNTNTTNAPKIASHVLVFFIVGVNTHLNRSVAYFPTANATSGELYAHFWEVVGELETSCDLHVIASTSDKASANQKFIRMHDTDEDKICNKTVNMFAPHRNIYFFSDAPHLLKTIRNNMYQSGHGKSKLMWNNNKHIEWKHISEMYEKDCTSELRKTKLTTDHINLTPHSVMNVKLAAQVMSKSVGVMMQAFGGPSRSETAKFILLTDRFFDCLNTRSLYECDRKRKDDVAPYTSITDCRFEFLQQYEDYVDGWKRNVASRVGTFTKGQRRQMFLSDQTYEGIKVTVASAVECTRFLLENGVKYVLTNRFCQDPLESHFGRHRGISGRSDNPNLYMYGHQEKKIMIQRSMALLLQPRGNVEKRKTATAALVSDDTPMKKKKK